MPTTRLEPRVTNPDDLILVSVDDHICEPREMFDAHVPTKYKEFAPQVITEDDGTERWWYGDIPGRLTGLNAVAGKPREYFNVDATRYDEMRPGCYDVHERVRDMSAGGQLAGLNFPNFTGFAGQVLNLGPDPKINEMMIRAYNDWHVDEWCGSYPDRFIPCGILPLFDVDLAAREVRRLAAKGCHAIAFSENPEGLNMPSIHSDAWDPLWAAACETETVLCCHLGSSSRGPQVGPDSPHSVTMTLGGCTSLFSMVELMWAGFWERFPTLRFSITEGDIGWMPYFVWRAEHVQRTHSGWTKHSFPEGWGPRTIFENNILSCFIADPVGMRLIDVFNQDNVFWESDFPHSDGTWPYAPERFAEVAAGLDDALIAKITHGNAMQHYKFDPFKHRAKEACTAGALRAEAADVDLVTRVGRKAADDEYKKFYPSLRPKRRSGASVSDQ
jgi:predicted TIM-barrel fold metal-dependent hydrolase